MSKNLTTAALILTLYGTFALIAAIVLTAWDSPLP